MQKKTLAEKTDLQKKTICLQFTGNASKTLARKRQQKNNVRRESFDQVLAMKKIKKSNWSTTEQN